MERRVAVKDGELIQDYRCFNSPHFFVSTGPSISSPIILFIYLSGVQEIFSICNI